ncbi:MAG: YfcE family phosphodiesterase [Spirochaetales bacterium]|nr:YfcE family phosphodiesterase [Spirochaetales bacterium]
MDRERILVFSDVHGDEMAMKRIREAEKELKTDSLLSLGDLCPDPYNPIWRGIRGVRGNMDRFYEYGDLPFPPRELPLNKGGRRIIAIHGHEYPSFTPERGDIVLYGHTHVAKMEERDGIYYFNPGSASRPRSSSGPSFGVLDDECFSIFSLLDFKRMATFPFSSSQ